MGKISEILDCLIQLKPDYKYIDELPTEAAKEGYKNNMRAQLDRDLRCKALQEVLLSKYRSYYSKLLDEGEADDILPLVKEINEDRKKKDEEQSNSAYQFITINPKPDVPLTEFKKVIEKASKKSFIKKCLYVIEQRGENMDELGKGFHAHFLINKGDYRPSHMRREFERSFKNISDISNPSCFNIRNCKKSDLKNRQNYMLELKSDPSKHLKQEYDKHFRKKFCIPEYYGEKFDEDIADFMAGL